MVGCPVCEISRDTDARSSQLQITAAREVNAFPGKFLLVSGEGDAMNIRQFETKADLEANKGVVSEVFWYRDVK